LLIPRSPAGRDIPLLSETDFGNGFSALFAPRETTAFIYAFNKLCTLFNLLAPILEILYPNWGAFPSALSPSESWHRRAEQLSIGERQLDRWQISCRHVQTSTIDEGPNAKSLFVLQKLSRMYYL
jgi:hypothetical protein